MEWYIILFIVAAAVAGLIIGYLIKRHKDLVIDTSLLNEYDLQIKEKEEKLNNQKKSIEEKEKISQEESLSKTQQGGNTGGLNAFNTEFVTKMSEVMAMMNDTSDSRIALLTSLKPFMSKRRASQIDSAMRLMQITKLSGILKKPLGR